MSALAAYLRERTAEDVRRLELSARIRLALQLGDDDLRLYCAANGTSIEEARRRLTAARQVGRRASSSAAIGR
ncbi:MAG: hypothetical protein ACRD2A_19135 [Vicinamibacterales bacterium]